jgi:hypothetical protein
MRTGIYVQKPTTVTICASVPQDARVQLRRFRVETFGADIRAPLPEPQAVGTHQLDAGIYLIVSSGPMQVEGDNLTTQIVANDKDGWPDPGATVTGLVAQAAMPLVKQFFAVSKGIEVDDAPPASTSPSTAKAGDDPVGR